MADLISQNMGTNPRKQTSWTSSNGLQTMGVMNPLNLTQNNQAVGYLGESQPTQSAPAQPTPQPAPQPMPQPAPAPEPTPTVPAAVSAVAPQMGGMSYTRPQGDMISRNMGGWGSGDATAGGGWDGSGRSDTSDPYATGVTGMDAGAQARQLMGQMPQQQGKLRAMSPQFGPDGAPSWGGGPRFMSNARRRLPYAPPSSPVSQ